MDLQIQWLEWFNKEIEKNKKGWRKEKRSLAGDSEGCAYGDWKLPSFWLTALVVREGGASAQHCSMSLSSVLSWWKGEVWSFCCWDKKSTNGYAGRYRPITLQINKENVHWQSEFLCYVFYSNSLTSYSSPRMLLLSYLLVFGVLWLSVCQCEWVETKIQDATRLNTMPVKKFEWVETNIQDIICLNTMPILGLLSWWQL